MNKKILWLSAPDMPVVTILHKWQNYFEEYKEWAITTKKDDDYDFIFLEESRLDEELLEDNSKPIICCFWGYPWFRLIHSDWNNHYKMKLRLLSKTDLVLVGSLVTFYQLCDFGISSLVCYPGVDNKLIDSVPEQEREFQICACGRLVAYKSFDVLIRAAAMINPTPKVVIIGHGEEKSRLIALAKELGVNLEIKTPNDYEKIKEFKKSLCVVAPSVYEGFGLVPVEALYAGVPAIVRDIPVARETLKEDAIYFVNENDLVHKLRYVINANIPNVGEFVKKVYTLEQACERLKMVFKKVKEY